MWCPVKCQIVTQKSDSLFFGTQAWNPKSHGDQVKEVVVKELFKQGEVIEKNKPKKLLRAEQDNTQVKTVTEQREGPVRFSDIRFVNDFTIENYNNKKLDKSTKIRTFIQQPAGGNPPGR